MSGDQLIMPGLFGDALKKELTDIYSQVTTNESTTAWEAEGDWYDEDDIRKELKGKPAQIDEVFKNAKTFFHPERKVTLS